MTLDNILRMIQTKNLFFLIKALYEIFSRKNIALVILFIVNPARAETILIKDISLLITGKLDNKSNLEVLHNKNLLIDNGVITKIGHDISLTSVDKIINATGKIVLPGFVDTHDHLWQVSVRGCGNNQELVEWLIDCNYNRNDITRQESFAAVRLGTYDLINSGVTTVMDWNPSYSENMTQGSLKALQQSGLRYVYGFYPRTEKDFIENAKELKEKIDKDPLGSFVIAGHPNKSLEAAAFKAVRLSKELNVPLNFHYGESIKDKKHEQPKVLSETGAYTRPLILNHVIHVSNDGIKAMADAHAGLTYNPLSNMRLGSGVMPASKLHQAGLTIGLGLDGAAQDNANFFAVMKAAVGIQRAVHQSVSVYPDYHSVISMATLDGARVLNLDRITGSIEKNKSADLIIINPATTNMAVSFDDVAQIAMNGEPDNVETVIVNGKLLKQNGQLIYSNESLNQLIDLNKKTVERFME